MKLDITAIDKNFLNGSIFEKEGLVWKSITESPFKIYGLAVCEGEDFFRLPDALAKQVSEGVYNLSKHTAGGRVRFRTDSKRIALSCVPRNEGFMSHMPLSGSAGIGIYVNGEFISTVRPANGDGVRFEGAIETEGILRDVELYLPLYNGITELKIGLCEGSNLLEPRPYTVEKPVVYYGSSITQGGCASKPGNSYQGFVSRWLDSDHINLGFSGNAKGEPIMAEYIAGLEMSAFVLDYDHNAPNAEHLKATHEQFFEIIRKANPTLPIIIASKSDTDGAKRADADKRRAVIEQTYNNAIRNGDRHVYYIDGRKLFGEQDRCDCTMDGAHPNDLGFYRMAQAFYPVIKQALTEA